MAAAFERCLWLIAEQGAITYAAAYAAVVGSSSQQTSMAEHSLAAKVCLVY